MAGIDTFIQVAVDGAGKMVRNFKNTIASNDVYQQVVTLAKSDGTLLDTGVPITAADGSNTAEGTTTDAAVVADANGTLSAKLRGLVKHAFERMPASLGQKLMAASLPVVLASDQASIPVAATLAAETTKVIGTVNQGSSPWNVGGSGGAYIQQTGTPNFNTKVSIFNAATELIGQKTMTVSVPVTWASDQSALPAGTNRIGSVRPVDSADADLTAAKGAQTSRAVGTQDLKDAGRNLTNYFMALPIVTTSTDTLMSLTGYKGGAAVTATTTPAVVTAAKTYRVTTVTITYVAITTAGTTRITLRANTGGVVAIGSPAVWNINVGGPGVTAGMVFTVSVPLPDGIEFAAGTGIGISQQGYGATQAAAAVGYGQVALTGYEY